MWGRSSCGSDRLESAVQELVIAGAPVCVLAESAVEVPFIEESTPMLGVVAATDKTYLLETLARWILDRTDKETAFAANFAFMRIAAANGLSSPRQAGSPIWRPVRWRFCRAPIIPLWRWRRWACSLSSLPSLDAALSPSAATRSRALLAGGLVDPRGHPRARQADACILGLPSRRSLLPRAPMAWAVRSFRSTSAMSTTAVPTRWSICHVLPRSRSGDHGRGRYPSHGVLPGRIRSRSLGVFRCALHTKTVLI